MKHLYLTLSLLIAVMVSGNLNAQSPIVDENFNDATDLPAGFFNGAIVAPIVADGKIQTATSQAYSVYIGSVTDTIQYQIQYTPATKWTQSTIMTLKNLSGDTLSQVVYDYGNQTPNSTPADIRGGLFICKAEFGAWGKTTGFPQDSADVVKVINGGVSRVDGTWQQDKMGMHSFSYTIDVTHNKARIYYNDTMRAETDLMAAPGNTLEFTLHTVNNGTFWTDSLVVVGTGTLLMEKPTVGIQQTLAGNVNMEINTVFTPAQGTFAPVFSENISNYTMNVYDLTGKVVFSTNNQNEGWAGNAAASMYIWSVQGTTQNGIAVNESGKVILVK